MRYSFSACIFLTVVWKKRSKLLVQPVYMNIATLYYIRTERPVTMQNRRVINVKVANARLPVCSITIRYAARDVYFRRDHNRGRCKFLRRSCVNWRERNRRVIACVSKDTRKLSLSLSLSLMFFFRLASCNNNMVAFHLRFRRTLFNILPSYSRGAVLQFIRRRWQRQPPAGSFGLIKFTDFHPPLYPPPTLLRHGTVSVSLRLRPSRFILAKRQSAWQFVSPEVGAHRNPRPPLGSRARVVLHYKADLFFSPFPISLLTALCSLSRSQPCPLPFETSLCQYW